eukprot:GFUD01010354.1.p1 GENE.GFUD01010354.1~~GFUD01010354.1.p1  ORF type:complete len:424 (+),score=128.92 GFUD01010354.1:116-1387(+)
MLVLFALTLLVPYQISISGIKVSPNCSQPLGMEDGRISDSQITASSSYQDNLVGASKARLNSEVGGGAWCPRSVIRSQDDLKEYLEINLLVDHVITSMVIQGRFANGLGQEYTEYYILQFWREGMDGFVEYREGEEGLLLRANTNTYQAVEHVLQASPVIASKVRILPFSHHPRTVCLRVEVKGCQYVGKFYDLLPNRSLENSAINSSYPQKALQVEDWGESTFLGAAVGILVTVVLAAISAIILVLVRNRGQRKSLSELSRYTSMNMNKDTSSSIQSSLTSQGHLVKLQHPDLIKCQKTEAIHPSVAVYSEDTGNYAPAVVLRCEQNSDEDSLCMDMFNTHKQVEVEQQSDSNGEDYLCGVPQPSHLSLPHPSLSSRSVSPTNSSSNPTTFITSRVTSGLPHKTAIIKYSGKMRPPLPAFSD